MSKSSIFYRPILAIIHHSGVRTILFTICFLFLTTSGLYGQFFESKIGLDIQNPLAFPEGVAADASGNIYVTDTDNNKVQKFNSSGQFITMWGSQGTGNGQFNFPSGIAVAPNGDVYVCEEYNDRVQKFSSTGAFITKWGSEGTLNGQFDNPTAIAVDAAGNVYVVDRDNERIQKFTSSGTFIIKWGHDQGNGDGVFLSPSGIAIDNLDVVYISDADRNLIQRFDDTGNFLGKWGSYGSGDGQFDSPEGIAVDADQNVFVTEKSNINRIQKFTSTGSFITKWGALGTENSKFNYPVGACTDAEGNVYVVDSWNNRIQKFDNDGAFVTKWGSVGAGDMEYFYVPFDVAVDQTGNLYVADTQNHRIQKYNSAGQFVVRWGSFGSADGQFNMPKSIAVDKNGNVYVADSDNDRVQKFTSNGSFITKWGSFGAGAGEFKEPRGIATDADGNVFVADGDNKRIQKFSSSGTFLQQWGSSGFGNNQFNYPNGIAVDKDGHVFVTDVTTDRVQEFTNTGEFLNVWGTGGEGNGQFAGPTGIDTDDAGNIYVSDSRNDRIQKFKSNGTYITQWGNEGPGDGQFDEPNGITVDQSGYAYVVDTRHHRIQKFSTLTIASFSSPSASPGSSVDIIGTGFNASASGNTVKLNGQAVPDITFASPTKLTIKIPQGATTGTISVQRGNYIDISSHDFIVLPFEIQSFQPSIGIVGTAVTISGNGFSSIKENNLVKFGNIPAEVIQSSATSLVVVVPAAAVTSNLSITISGQVVTSATQFVVTKLAITQTSYPDYFSVEESGLAVSVTFNNTNELQSLKFKSKAITEGSGSVKTTDVTFSTSSNTVSFTIPAANFTDRLGLYSWFSATDKSGNEIVSEPEYTYLHYPATSTKQNIPALTFGKSVGSYQLISIPLQLDNASVTEIFKDLGGYDDKKWRLFSLMSDDIKEYPAFSSLQQGQGYWLIVANQTEINPGEGRTLTVTPDDPFTITLHAGWNLVGNPYDFTISSEDVEEANGLPSGTLDFKQFLGGSFKNEPMLQRYNGAFVYTDVAREIIIPLINHSPTGGRKNATDPQPLDAPAWEVNLSMKDGDISNELFGFGMNPMASNEKDIWDEIALPMLEGMTSYKMIFKQIQDLSLTKDVVPTEENYSWQSTFSSDNEVIISWDNSFFGENDRQLVMESSNDVEVIDMRKQQSFKLRPGDQVLRFHYGTEAYVRSMLQETRTRLGNVYPNPLPTGTSLLSAFMSLPEGSNQIALQLQDALGRNTVLSGTGNYDGGRKAIQWEENFSQLHAGLYVLRIEVLDSLGIRHVQFRKVIVE